jgi:membrane fusion protein, multidrug efflux system
MLLLSASSAPGFSDARLGHGLLQRGMFALLCMWAFTANMPALAQEPLESAAVQRKPMDEVLVLPAVLEASESASVAAQIQGRIVGLLADTGDTVKKGQVLARIDPSELAARQAQASAGVREAESALIQARAHAERTAELYRDKFVSKAGLEAAQAALSSAQSRFEAARAGAVQVQVMRDYAEIRAPFDAVVARRHQEEGEMAQPGLPLFTLHVPAHLRAVAQVPQNRLAGVTVLSAEIELPAPPQRFKTGEITVFPSADPRTHSFTVRATVAEDPDTAALTPGLFVRLHLVTGTEERLVIPHAGLLQRGDLTAVYVMDEQGGIRLRQVRVGPLLPGAYREVLSGLKEGERVALDPVKAGIRARPRP